MPPMYTETLSDSSYLLSLCFWVEVNQAYPPFTDEEAASLLQTELSKALGLADL